MSKHPVSPHKLFSRRAALVAAALWLAGCAPATRVILLPQADSPSSQVVVSADKAELVIDKPYGVAEVSRDGRVAADSTTAQDVASAYPSLLALQPPAPEQYTLQFEPGSSQLTEQSQALLDKVIERAKARTGGEIIVTGHTDRQGAAEDNDRLSLERANAIRDMLIGLGFRAELIEAVGRGEREPVVPTDDEIEEPRNRRAEVWIR